MDGIKWQRRGRRLFALSSAAGAIAAFGLVGVDVAAAQCSSEGDGADGACETSEPDLDEGEAASDGSGQAGDNFGIADSDIDSRVAGLSEQPVDTAAYFSPDGSALINGGRGVTVNDATGEEMSKWKDAYVSGKKANQLATAAALALEDNDARNAADLLVQAHEAWETATLGDYHTLQVSGEGIAAVDAAMKEEGRPILGPDRKLFELPELPARAFVSEDELGAPKPAPSSIDDFNLTPVAWGVHRVLSELPDASMTMPVALTEGSAELATAKVNVELVDGRVERVVVDGVPDPSALSRVRRALARVRPTGTTPLKPPLEHLDPVQQEPVPTDPLSEDAAPGREESQRRLGLINPEKSDPRGIGDLRSTSSGSDDKRASSGTVGVGGGGTNLAPNLNGSDLTTSFQLPNWAPSDWKHSFVSGRDGISKVQRIDSEGIDSEGIDSQGMGGPASGADTWSIRDWDGDWSFGTKRADDIPSQRESVSEKPTAGTATGGRDSSPVASSPSDGSNVNRGISDADSSLGVRSNSDTPASQNSSEVSSLGIGSGSGTSAVDRDYSFGSVMSSGDGYSFEGSSTSDGRSETDSPSDGSKSEADKSGGDNSKNGKSNTDLASAKWSDY